MAEALEKLKVVIEGSLAPYKKMLNEAKAETNRATEDINKKTSAIKSPFSRAGGEAFVSELRKMQDRIRQSVKGLQVDSGIKEYTDGYEQVKGDIERAEKALGRLGQRQRDLLAAGDNKKASEPYLKLEESVQRAEDQLESLRQKKKELEASGGDMTVSHTYRNLDAQLQKAQEKLGKLNASKGKTPESRLAIKTNIAETEKEIDALKRQMDAVSRSGGGFVATKEMERLEGEIQKTSENLQSYRQELSQMVSSGSNIGTMEWQKLQGEIASAEQRLRSYKAEKSSLEHGGKDLQFSGFKNAAGSVISKSFSGLKSVFGSVTSGIKKAGGAAASLINRFKNGIPIVNKFGNAMKKTGGSGRGLGGIFKTLGMTAKFMLASFAIKGAVNGAKEGLQNLAQYSGETNKSMSMLMSAMTRLKNSLGTAFAPILNVVAPILTTLINYLTKATTAIGQFFSALTGKSSAVVAKQVNQDYAASLDKNTSSANKADKANKKLQRTLMGFDQINKLDDHSDSEKDASGGLSPSDMFETTGIDGNVSDFVNKVKEAWANADFTDIGRIVGSKLNEALNSIPWTKIKNTSGKIARSIATFLNGFIEETDWSLVGSTLSEGINTIIEFGYNFVTTFKWKEFGKAISDGINGAIRTLDWKKAAWTLSDGIKGLLDTVIIAIENINWFQLGEKVKDFLANIDWSGITYRLFELIGAALGGLSAFLGGLLGDAVMGTGAYFQDKIEECGGDIVAGILKGIWDALVGIGNWIYDNIFVPIIGGFKKAFGIHSPSTVMAEQGGFIISGLLTGLKDKIGSVIDWFKELPGKVKNSLGNAKDWLVEKGQGAIEGIKNGWESVKNSRLLSNVGKLKEDAFASVGNIAEKMKQKGSDIVAGIKDGYENNKGSIKTAVSGVPDLISNGIGSLWKIGRNAISSFIDGFKSLKIPTPHFSVSGNVKIAGIETPIPKLSVNWYAAGGFPGQGEMFVARENGPELVGRMGSRSTVANNGQIIEGIKSGVFEAVMDAFAAGGTMFGGGSSGQVVLEFTFMCDSETFYKITKKGKQKHDDRFTVVETI